MKKLQAMVLVIMLAGVSAGCVESDPSESGLVSGAGILRYQRAGGQLGDFIDRAGGS